jgi:membrane protease YdiL (CAAX protease family)
VFGGMDASPEGHAGLQILWLALITTGWASLIAAVVEELVFRGFLYRHLIASAGPWLTCIITSLCFALVHQDQQLPGRDLFEYSIDHLFLWIRTFIAGLMYFVIRHFSGSLILVVLVHLSNNAMVELLSAAMP